MTDPKLLRQLQDEVRELAAELAERRPRKVMRDEGPATEHVAIPLLEQLRRAVATGGEVRGGGRRGSPSPISEAAFDLLDQLAVDAADLHVKAVTRDRIEVEDRVRALAAIAGRWTDPVAVAGVRNYLKAWAREISLLLDPPRRLELVAPCPACDTKTVLREEAGEQIRVPALYVDGQAGCRCLACGHHWPTTHLQLLAGALGCPPIGAENTGEEGSAA